MYKTFSGLFLLFIFSFDVFSQDIIVKNNGDEIEANVLEITSTSIKFRFYNTPNGPIRNIDRTDVFMIIYEDGSREIFTKNSSTKEKRGFNKYNKYNYIGASFGYGNSYGGLGLSTSIKLGKNFKWGIHTGFGVMPTNTDIVLGSIGVKLYLVEGLYVNLQFGGFGYSYYSVFSHDRSYVSEKLMLGPSLLVGYELHLSNNIAFKSSFGTSYDIDTVGVYREFWYAIDAGIIIKFLKLN